MNRILRTPPSSLLISIALVCTMAGCGVAYASSADRKSISSYVSCSGTGDDTVGATKAFAAAKNSAFTLVVDCPVRLHSGVAVDRGIFIDNGTSVEFTGSGQFIVDNIFHPAFVIANSNNINLTNWNVVWDGVVPIDASTGGYEINGKFVTAAAGTKAQPAAAFNDLVLTNWLAANRSIGFINSQGWVKSVWIGGVNISAVFFITGDASDIVFKGLRLSVPPAAGGDHFLPMAFSFSPNWKSNQAVNGKMPRSAQYVALPHKLTFSDVYFDGTLMGWQGNVRDATFDNVQSHRYGDLQDANGGNTGGIGKWFPPPHLFYLNYNYNSDGDPELFNSNIHISNVVDSGPRVGVARDKGGADGMSGYASSLKLGCTKCSVDKYSSTRPDGFMDVLPSDGLTVSNVTATYDSTFLNNVYPAGIRFPANGYRNITFENVVLKDLADSPAKEPIGNAPSATNSGITFRNVQVVLNRWSGQQLPVPTIAGNNNSVTIDYMLPAQQKKVTYRLQDNGRWSTPSP
jgi:hypothetical protein